jgi:hypothetical protein
LQVFYAVRQGKYCSGSYGEDNSYFYSEWDTACESGKIAGGWRWFLDVGRSRKISFIILGTKNLAETYLDIIRALEKVAERSNNNQNSGSNNDEKVVNENVATKMPKEDGSSDIVVSSRLESDQWGQWLQALPMTSSNKLQPIC